MTSNQGNLLAEVSLPMPEVEQSKFISEEIEKLESALHEHYSSQIAKPLIQRVPRFPSGVQEYLNKYFEPSRVAFGPLHHGNPKFEWGQQTKRKLAAYFAHVNGTTSLALYNMIKGKIDGLRKCYNEEDTKDYDDDQLAWMFFVDGCAVLYAIHYFCCIFMEDPSVSRLDDFVIFRLDDFGIFLFVDMLLIENQLPYLVLKILIDSTRDPQDWKESISEFLDLVVKMHTNVPSGQIKHTQENKEEREDYAHILEQLREKLVTGIVDKPRSSMIFNMFACRNRRDDDWIRIPSIRELTRSGVKVRPSESSRSLKNISFDCAFPGCLKMPRLTLNSVAISKFMNLVALEKCRDFKNDLGVASYLSFFFVLIRTPEDVKELRLAGMLQNFLGTDEELAHLFKTMTSGSAFNTDIYQDVLKNIDMYCSSWVIQIYSRYFSGDWSFIAFLAALAGLVLTFLQTYFTIYPGSKH